MKCSMVREKFIPYLEGEARLTERLCVEVHITYCYHCREELDELRELLASSRAAIRHPHPTDRFDLLMERIARNEAAVQAASPQRRWRWRDHAVRLAVAAGIVIAVGASSPFLLHSTRGIAPRQNTPAPVNNAAAYSAHIPVVSRPLVEWKFNIEEEIELQPAPSQTAAPDSNRDTD